jgi:hypothetical protein
MTAQPDENLCRPHDEAMDGPRWDAPHMFSGGIDEWELNALVTCGEPVVRRVAKELANARSLVAHLEAQVAALRAVSCTNGGES